ncbi:hypothetical protein O3M35_006240 [Rhynocoris fuscipes]|uniref:Uncharacterized protein n=1 Tax=Rhynocoris fuscipes TaxID=488301 RepID=A0AAW1DFB4_9HEMI
MQKVASQYPEIVFEILTEVCLSHIDRRKRYEGHTHAGYTHIHIHRRHAENSQNGFREAQNGYFR